MGGLFSYPESMKDLPSNINENQYIKMILTGNGNKDGTYFIQKRGWSSQFSQQFTGNNMMMNMAGLGFMNQGQTSQFYVTKDKLNNDFMVSLLWQPAIGWK